MKLVDSAENIRELLLDGAKGQLNLSIVSEIINTSLATAVELDYADFVKLSDSAINIDNLTNIEIVVIGASSELQTLFEDLNSDPSLLLDAVSFRSTDGGGVWVGLGCWKHSTVAIKAPLPWLQERCELEEVLDNAIPTTSRASS